MMEANEIALVADSIESNIENVHGNVELGQQELQKASAYQVDAAIAPFLEKLRINILTYVMFTF
jgi:t-SNARE complex subunit (syntaxin)